MGRINQIGEGVGFGNKLTRNNRDLLRNLIKALPKASKERAQILMEQGNMGALLKEIMKNPYDDPDSPLNQMD